MVRFTPAEMRVLEEVLDMSGGYVLDFSNRTMAEYFESEFGLAIFEDKYAIKGTSKRTFPGWLPISSAWT